MMSRAKWTIVDTGMSSAMENMEIDAKLLEKLDPFSNSPILHLYDWQNPCATYGHFIKPSNHLLKDVAENKSLELVKRPTGGGLILHTNDWAFSLLVPASSEDFSMNTLDNYAFVNTLLINVISQFTGIKADFSLLALEPNVKDSDLCNFCMAKPTKYDVILNGKKICGGAQRRTKSGFLHQGTVSLSLPDKSFLDKIIPPNISKAIYENTFPLLGEVSSSKDFIEAKQDLKNTFITLIKGF